MTQEEKELLLKDLCARLSYGVKLGFSKEDKGSPLTIISFNIRTGLLETEENENINNYSLIRHIYQSYCYKPYLRPMSSMTDEEERVFEETLQYTQYTLESYDWLNAHHFDYRGLIEKGLALEATEDMYKFE